MDNFMDKITQKLNSQDMIRANAAADAAELENLENQVTVFKEQIEKYDDCLQEMRQLNLRNIESAKEVKDLTRQAGESLEKTAGEVESASVSRIKQTSDLSIAGIQQTQDASIAGIKQTSDVSIAGIRQTSDASIAGINQTVAESLAKIAEIQDNSGKDNLEKMTETVSGLKNMQDEAFRSLEDFLHTDNVKVYRNVQAAMIEELDKQTNELKEAQEKTAKSSKVLLPFVIISMILTLANTGILIAQILGLF